MVVDVGVDVVVRTSGRAARVLAAAGSVVSPVASLALRPPLVPQRLWPQTRLVAMAERGRRIRSQAERRADVAIAELIPAVIDAVLDRIDLTALVLERVDLDAIAGGLDLDAIAAGLDVNAVAARLELDPVVDRVPIDRVLNRVDIDAIVASVDLQPIIARIDIDAIAAGLDLDAIIDRVDVVAIANQVIDEIDLPEIIRESSGAMASETVVGVRMQGIEADERVNRIVDRILLRRRDRNVVLPASSNDGHGVH